MVVSDTNIVSLDWRKIMFDKYGNDLDYWYYCPVCGRSLLPSFNTCVKHKNIKLVKSLHKKDYYEKKLKERKDYISSGFKIVEEEEIIKNPLYNPKSAESSKKEKASNKPNSSKSNLIYCLIAAFVCLLFVGWILNMFKSNDDRSSDAWVCAEDIVRQNLKSPSSAKFCTYPEATIKDKGNNEYMITGWVNADNSFGVNIRTNFTVTLTLTQKGYKNARCYFDDDSLYVIAGDIVKEDGLDDNEDDSMKEYISKLIDEEYANKSSKSDTAKSTVPSGSEETTIEETVAPDERNSDSAKQYYYDGDIDLALAAINKIENKTDEIQSIEADILAFKDRYSAWLGKWSYSVRDNKCSLWIKAQYNDGLTLAFETGKTTAGETIVYDLYEYNGDSLIYHSDHFSVFDYTTVTILSDSQIELVTKNENTGNITSPKSMFKIAD